jgi:hypothetical protein
MIRELEGSGSSTRSRKAALTLLLFAGLWLMVSLLAAAFDSSVLEPFSPSAPPM